MLQRRMATNAQAQLDSIGAEAAKLAAEAPELAAFLPRIEEAVAAVADELVGRTQGS